MPADRLGLEPGDRLAKQSDRPAPRRQEPDDGADACALARAVSAEQCEQLAGLYRKRDALQHMAVAVKRIDAVDRHSSEQSICKSRGRIATP